MSSGQTCRECGTAIPADSPGGFCAQCLLGLGLQQGESLKSEVQSQPSEVAGLPTEKPGDRIGRYRLLQEIGHGGCGVVYMAEQEEPVRRKVALKVIKLGMDTRQVVARFEAERQALALMDHPNIAKIYDAGVTEAPLPASGHPLPSSDEGGPLSTRQTSHVTSPGRPYFAMELVGGIKITDYCDQNQLPTRQRLDLFIQVCRAIQHAHQKGIIHRDIKPSNVLVATQDGVPVPKVIDFGIAKATQGKLTDQTLFTAFEQFIGTPTYTSPEQAQLGGLDVDTRSDIYSLGVLLYELLTGTTPFDTKELVAAGLDEMRRTIREVEPVRPSTRLTRERERTQGRKGEKEKGGSIAEGSPSTLNSQLSTDLDWIVMKCLEKDRARRYETANGLASDIQRHLNNEPVTARPPSKLYEFQKTVRRHKFGFAATAAVILVLAAGATLSTWQAVRASRAERDQRRLFQEAERARADESKQREQAEAARQLAVRSQLRARENLYDADMVLAFQALEKGHLGRLRELLAKYSPSIAARTVDEPPQADLRGWEWRHLWGRSRGDDMFALRGHSRDVSVVTVLGDGRTILSGSSDRTLRFWDCETRSLLESIPYPDEPRSGALSPDGRWFVAGGNFGYWSLWDVVKRHRLLDSTNSSPVVGTAFSPLGDRFAIVDHNLVEVWTFRDRHQVKTIPRSSPKNIDFVLGVAFSPDGNKLAYADGGFRIMLHDLLSGSEVVVGAVPNGEALHIGFSPDGRVVVSTHHDKITVWDVAGGAPPKHLTNHLEQVVCTAFSFDGKLLASASGDQTIKLWETKEWREIATLRGHEQEVHCVAFSPDGKFLVSSGKDQTVRVWAVPTNSPTHDHLGWSDWSYVAPRKPTRNRQMRIHSNRESFQFMDLTELKDSATQSLPPIFRSPNPISVAPGADMLAVGLEGGPVELWRTEPLEKLRALPEARVGATLLALSESGRWLAVNRQEGTTELWDLHSDRLIETLPALAEPVRDALQYQGLSFWAGDRRLVRATARSRQSEELIEIFLISEHQRQLIRHSHKTYLCNFAVSDDGRLLATASYDGCVKLWDVESGRELDTLVGQLVGFVSLAFSPDGARLAAGGWDGTITLWDLDTRQQVANWKAHRINCHWVCFIDSGEALASSGYSGVADVRDEIRIWRGPALRVIEESERAETP